MRKVRVGIIGAAGYTGGEALRLLAMHPQAEIAFAASASHAGSPVSAVHSDLIGTLDLAFAPPPGTAAGQDSLRDVDVVFLCSGHGTARRFMAESGLDESTKVIDLSHDYRLAAPDNDFVYGLPEHRRTRITEAYRVANPGCFATAIQLALLPLANEGLLSADIHVTAVTGSTGAGQQPTASSHFSWRSQNLSVYKAFDHQHLAEINQTLKCLQGDWDGAVNFVPMRGPFTRGILASLHLDCDLPEDRARSLFEDFYASHPFTHVVSSNPDVKQVVNTNNALLYLEKHGKYLHIVGVIDNLLKGAAGQAVQNMNLMCGLPEKAGLSLKAAVF